MDKASFDLTPGKPEPTPPATGATIFWSVIGMCIGVAAIMGTIKLGMVLFG